jgi:hypothetical protein
MLPLPWVASEPRFTDAQVDTIQPGQMDREAVRALLGDPDLHREAQKVWIYGSAQSHGRFLVLGGLGVAWTRLYFSYRVLFLEFDGDGQLLTKAVVDAGMNASDDRVCAPQRLCVQGWLEETSVEGIVVARRLDNAATSVFRAHAETETGSLIQPLPQTCALVLLTPKSKQFEFRVDFLWTDYVALSNTTYVLVYVPPGVHVLSTPSFPDETFRCETGETVGFELRTPTDADARYRRLVMNRLDESAAIAAIAGRWRLLLPDPPTSVARPADRSGI